MTLLIILLVILALLFAAAAYFFRFTFARAKEGGDWGNKPTDPRDIAFFEDPARQALEIRSRDGLKLVGHFLPAEAEEARGTLLLVHGYRSSPWTDFGIIYTYFHSLGWNILTVHQRAHGESEGKYITFGIKERFQITHRTGSFNTYQSATNAMVLKSRISAKYRGFSFGKPYAYAEVRNTLNAPAIKANYNAALDPPYYSADGSSDAGWFIDSWSNMYVNRLRGCLGCDFELSKSHGIDVYVLTEYCTDKSVDANKEGTKLKSYTLDHSLNFILGVGYTYSF